MCVTSRGVLLLQILGKRRLTTLRHNPASIKLNRCNLRNICILSQQELRSQQTHKLLTDFSRTGFVSCHRNLHVQWQWNHGSGHVAPSSLSHRFYSTQKDTSITDHELQQVITTEAKTDDTTNTETVELTEEQKKKEEEEKKKKNSWFSSQNAWKLGLVSMVGMGVVMSLNLIMLWGKFVC